MIAAKKRGCVPLVGTILASSFSFSSSFFSSQRERGRTFDVRLVEKGIRTTGEKERGAPVFVL